LGEADYETRNHSSLPAGSDIHSYRRAAAEHRPHPRRRSRLAGHRVLLPRRAGWQRERVLDRIAAQGMRFMHAYSPSATCSPSRAAIMAGQFTPRTGVLHVTGGEVPAPFNASFAYMDGFYPCRLDLTTPTIARVLKDAGYTTAHIKKWHLGGRSDGYPGPLQYGFDFSWDAKTKDYNDPELWDSARKGKSEYYNGLWLPLNPRHKGFATDKPNDPFLTDPGDNDRPFDGVSDLALRWLGKAYVASHTLLGLAREPDLYSALKRIHASHG
jgi:arylsulfatase A-like enzyme